MLRTLWTMRAERPGRKADGFVAVLSINFNPTNCLEFISQGLWDSAAPRKTTQQCRGRKAEEGFWWCCGVRRVHWELLFCILPVAFEQFRLMMRVRWDCTFLVNKLWDNLWATAKLASTPLWGNQWCQWWLKYDFKKVKVHFMSYSALEGFVFR